jgi:hypothetical protein
VTEHVPLERVQEAELKLPYPDGEALKVTVPVGVVLPLPPVSATVTVQVEAWFTTTVDWEHMRVVLVVLSEAVRGVDPLLDRKSPTPA